jgi:hypothetical protein
VQINEDYRTYSPPRWVRRTVERLLSSVPETYCRDLHAVVLTDAEANSARRSVQMRRNRGKQKLGVYHRAFPEQPAWIELISDRIVTEKLPKVLQWFQWARDAAFSQVLFHELGHHLTITVGSRAREGEGSADAWSSVLSGAHFQRHFGYLKPLHPIIRYVVRRIRSRKRITTRSKK